MQYITHEKNILQKLFKKLPLMHIHLSGLNLIWPALFQLCHDAATAVWKLTMLNKFKTPTRHMQFIRL